MKFEYMMRCTICPCDFEANNDKSGKKWAVVQHEKYAKHKRALQIRAASNAEQSTECHGTIVRGAKNEQLLGKVFCSLCEHWPHHGGQLGTFIIPHFMAANDNSTEIVFFFTFARAADALGCASLAAVLVGLAAS